MNTLIKKQAQAEGAYLSVCSVEFVFNASATCAAPSALRSFQLKLQTRIELKCQRLMTVGIEVRGGVLELLEGCVLLEALREVLGGLRVQMVVAEAANTGGIGCQRLLTVFFEGSVAYLSEVRALFSFRPSARCSAASASRRLFSRLPLRDASECQRLLTLSTVGKEAQDGILEVFERRVDREHVGDVLSPLRAELIVVEAASEGRIGVSAAADSLF